MNIVDQTTTGMPLTRTAVPLVNLATKQAAHKLFTCILLATTLTGLRPESARASGVSPAIPPIQRNAEGTILLYPDPPRVDPTSLAGMAGRFASDASAYASGDYRMDSLLSGYQWSGGVITYSFYSTALFADPATGDYHLMSLEGRYAPMGIG